ncbi:MAG TPA: glycosyltransferase [Phycisphaerae bacterium]|nr:glycosyltransferase [Phycisphaerae bacterium]
MHRPLRILSTSLFYYYGDTRGIEPQFYYLVKVPQSMGHEVDFFDWHTHARGEMGGSVHMRRLFLNVLRSGRYDAAFIATFKEEFDQETLEEAKRLTTTFAFNSDDEWRWADYSQGRAPWYSFMVTNSPTVHARFKGSTPNLLHCQWACTGFWNGRDTKKDVDFSFAGMIHGTRKEQIQALHQRAGLAAFGMGAKELGLAAGENVPEDLRDARFQTTLPFETINQVWNRSKVSFTPLDSSDGRTRQIKSRIFDMGLSRTLMLAHGAPELDRYYEPGKEYVPFETLEEAAEKAGFYVRNEGARREIAEAYARRTQGEHLWSQRLTGLLKEAALLKEAL